MPTHDSATQQQVLNAFRTATEAWGEAYGRLRDLEQALTAWVRARAPVVADCSITDEQWTEWVGCEPCISDLRELAAQATFFTNDGAPLAPDAILLPAVEEAMPA